MTEIAFDHVGKVFGPRPETVWPLLAEGVSKAEILARTGHTVALDDVTLTIGSGEVFVVMGASGSGKSTLLRLINRLIAPSRGTVTVDGTTVADLNDAALREFRRAKFGMVFQSFGLLPHKTVRDNVAFPLALQGVAKSERYERAKSWIARVGLDGYADALPGALSGGMQQRVGFARALVGDPPILLMDEPMAALDPVTRRDMQDELLRLQGELKKTMVMITHDPAEALRLADRIAVMRDGAVVQIGTPDELTRAPTDAGVAAFVRGFAPGR